MSISMDACKGKRLPLTWPECGWQICRTIPERPRVYEYYAGRGPALSANASLTRPVFVDPGGHHLTHVVYVANLSRYLPLRGTAWEKPSCLTPQSLGAAVGL